MPGICLVSFRVMSSCAILKSVDAVHKHENNWNIAFELHAVSQSLNILIFFPIPKGRSYINVSYFYIFTKINTNEALFSYLVYFVDSKI